jgi:hypothetical protein
MSEEEKQDAVPEDTAPPETKNITETKSPTYKGDTHTTDFHDDGMWPEYANPNYRMPEEIEVTVKSSAGDYSFPVEITKASTRKLYYGGYKHAKNKLIYHNASTQTPIESKNIDGGTKLRTRETQTYDMKSISVQPNREHGTQMQRVDLYLDDSRDNEITPKEYFTSDDLLFLKKVKCVELQRVWRGHMARGRAVRMRSAMVANEEAELVER